MHKSYEGADNGQTHSLGPDQTLPTPLSGLDSFGLALPCETVILPVKKVIIKWEPGVGSHGED